jgi:dihydrofolate synthase / folylpolyglutamate synthase
VNEKECIHYLSKFYSRSTNRNGHHLLIMKELFYLFNIKEDQFDIVQVTGSCGKGSTVTYISWLLSQNNIVHGVFTGPHLLRYEERFAVNGSLISSHVFCEIVTNIAETLKKYENEKEVGHMHVMTLIAFIYFRTCGVKLVIFENGSGGFSDPSNILNPVIALLTEITLDHTHLLGNSVEEITTDKAAIIKNHTKYVIAGMYNKQAKDMLKQMERAKNARFLYMNENYQSDYKEGNLTYRGFTKFTFSTLFSAAFQQQNFTNALCAIELLNELGYNIKLQGHSKLQNVIIPGRMEWTEMAQQKILLDGAHNEYELAALKTEIKQNHLRNPLFLIAFSSNKDIEKMVNSIAIKEAFYIIVPSPFNERRINQQGIEDVFQSFQLSYTYYESVEIGLRDFIKYDNKRSKVVTGSLYLVGFIKQKQKEGFMNDIYNNETC